MLVRFDNVVRSFGAFDVLDQVSFQLDPGQKLGLIGANGSGKTTLLSLIEHPEDVDQGQVDRARSLRIGTLAQQARFASETLLDEGLSVFEHLQSTEQRLRRLEARIGADHAPPLLDEYSDLQHAFEHQGGYTYRARTEAALSGLGFRHDQFGRAPESLSGGEKNRLALACLLLAEVDLLLLDEPTNHLDIRAIEWLEHHLRDTGKAILLVSHDRLFLDRVVHGVLELEAGRLREYRGNYTAYLDQKNEWRKSQEKAWKKQQEWISKTEEYIRRNIAGQNTKQAQSRRKALEKLERIERPAESAPAIRFRFAESRRTPRCVLRTDKLAVGYDSGHPLVHDLSVEIEKGERWAILGPNGSGKTTLLRVLSGLSAPLGGDLERNETHVGYYDQELRGLESAITVLDALRSLDRRATDGELRSFLAGFLFRGDSVHKTIGNLSGGERSRLALAKLVYQAPPVLSLDEPTNHLDIESREALEAALAQYPGTLFFVTHDRRLVERVATRILYLERGETEIFDSFTAFEQRLAGDAVVARESVPAPLPGRGDEVSKNRKREIRNKIQHLESGITRTEAEIAAAETAFQSPGPEFDWPGTTRRHRELKDRLEQLYAELEDLLKAAD